MTATATQIERVVREVLAEMGVEVRGSSGNGNGNGTATANPPTSQPAPPSQPAPRDALVLGGSLITLSDVEGRLSRIKTVLVPTDAVVTPSVRDALHNRGIALRRETNEAITGGNRIAPVAIRVVSNRWDFAPLVNMLRRDGLTVTAERSDCLIQSTDHLAEQATGGAAVGVVLSTHPAMALCLANRHAGVRAVVARQRDQAAAEIADVGANVIVLDQTSLPLFNLKQIIADFARGGVRPCPESLSERLA